MLGCCLRFIEKYMCAPPTIVEPDYTSLFDRVLTYHDLTIKESTVTHTYNLRPRRS